MLRLNPVEPQPAHSGSGYQCAAAANVFQLQMSRKLFFRRQQQDVVLMPVVFSSQPCLFHQLSPLMAACEPARRVFRQAQLQIWPRRRPVPGQRSEAATGVCRPSRLLLGHSPVQLKPFFQKLQLKTSARVPPHEQATVFSGRLRADSLFVKVVRTIPVLAQIRVFQLQGQLPGPQHHYVTAMAVSLSIVPLQVLRLPIEAKGRVPLPPAERTVSGQFGSGANSLILMVSFCLPDD